MTSLECHRGALCEEIENSRIRDDETPSTVGPKHGVKSSWYSRRRNTYSVDKTVPQTPVDPSCVPSYVPLKDSPQLTRRKRSTIQSYGRSYSLDSDRASDLTRKSEDSTDAGIKEKDKDLMTGWLHKTSRLKNSKTKGHSRQHRMFRLTAHSLEYNHNLQKVRKLTA